jgi:hypothetical protein
MDAAWSLALISEAEYRERSRRIAENEPAKSRSKIKTPETPIIDQRARDKQLEIGRAIESKRLVVVNGSGSRLVYFEGDMIKLINKAGESSEWRNSPIHWDLFRELAKAATSGCGVKVDSVETAKFDRLRMEISRLRKSIASEELKALIMNGGAEGGFRLDLKRHEVAMFEITSADGIYLYDEDEPEDDPVEIEQAKKALLLDKKRGSQLTIASPERIARSLHTYAANMFRETPGSNAGCLVNTCRDPMNFMPHVA